MDEKPQGGAKVGADLPVVGNDIPDESKERHTEIAVEAGRKVGEHRRQALAALFARRKPRFGGAFS